MELDKIIKRIEDKHITMIETSPKEQEHREKEKEIKIKQEDDDNFFEVAYSAKQVRDINKTNDTLRQSNCHNEHQSIHNQGNLFPN